MVPAREGRELTAPSAPDSTAVRVALWRALHVELDPPPHVLNDIIGLRLAEPDPDWRTRGDMHPEGTRAFRASIVARARFLDDLVVEQAAAGIGQYVILGAGLDTFAQRHPDVGLHIYEVDQPGTQEWKRRRLTEEGYPLPERSAVRTRRFRERRVVAGCVDGQRFRHRCRRGGLVDGRQHVPDQEATEATLRQVAALQKRVGVGDDVHAAAGSD